MVRNDVEKYLFWILGRGDIDISLDKWLKYDIPIMIDRVVVRSIFFTENEIDMSLAQILLGCPICDVIKKEIITLSNTKDKLVWACTSFKNFTIWLA